MKVFQIWISEPTDSTKTISQNFIPKQLEVSRISIEKCLPDCKYEEYNFEKLFEFIHKNFGTDVAIALEKLKPKAYQADLGRYCLLYQYGGWYVDAGTKLLTQIVVDQSVNMILFRDFGDIASCKPWAIQNGFFYAKPKETALNLCIERILKNIASNFYGDSPLCPTGPNLFGKCIAEQSNGKFIHGSFQALTPNHSLINLMYISTTGKIIAQHKTSWCSGLEGGDFSQIGIKGTNNYKSLWNQRNIYKLD